MIAFTAKKQDVALQSYSRSVVKGIQMIKWLVAFWKPIEIQYLSVNYCDDKTEEQLLEKLKSGKISMQSGIMIVTELLERLHRKSDKSFDAPTPCPEGTENLKKDEYIPGICAGPKRRKKNET